jgi:peptidase M50B-like protein
MKPETKRKLTFLAGFVAYFGVLWALWDTPVVYPLKIFVVLLHEASHGIMALATGGAIDYIQLDPRQGGLCMCSGNAFLTLSAGYLGSLTWGILLVLAAQAERINSRIVTGFIGFTVVGLTIAYVDGLFGVGFGLVAGVALVFAAKKLPALWNQRVLMTLGLTSVLYAVLDIKSDVLDRPELQSDAAMLGDLTGIATQVWGVLWITIALLAIAWLLHRSYREA